MVPMTGSSASLPSVSVKSGNGRRSNKAPLVELLMGKSSRKHTPTATELGVLDKSRWRCALCFQFRGDLSEKLGQIAHLDENPANTAEDNLAWLCLEHHTLYDSTTSQHKNYTIAEAKAARARLYALLESGGHLTGNLQQQVAGIETDRKTLAEIQTAMSKVADYFLRHPNFGACSFGVHELEAFEAAVVHQNKPEHEFIDPELEELRWKFVSEGETLFNVMMSRLRPIRTQEGWYSLPWEWQQHAPDRLERVWKSLDDQAVKVRLAYHELIRAARRKLEK
jgi:hypothetical protein